MEVIPLETVVSMIRERRDRIDRHSLISIDDDEVATYQIEITTDSSVRTSLPPQFSLNGDKEYLAEFDFVQAEEDEKEPDVVHFFGVESAPVTKKKEGKESIEPVARFSPFRNRKQAKGTNQVVKKTSSFDGVEVPLEPITRFSPFRKKKRAEHITKSESVHGGVVVAVAPVAPATGCSPFRKKTRCSSKPAKRSSVSYFEASIEPETQSTPPPPWKNKRFGIKSSASLESTASASPFGSVRFGAKHLAVSTEPATESTQGNKTQNVLSAMPCEPTTASMPARENENLNESIKLGGKLTPVSKNEGVKKSMQLNAKYKPTKTEIEDVKESIQLDIKSKAVKTENDVRESFVVSEKIDVTSNTLKKDEDLVSFDLNNASTPAKKSKQDDDTKSTTTSSDSDLSPTKSPIASHAKRGTNQKATVGLRLFERYLENALDKIAGSCICTSAIPLKCAPLKCNPALEEEEEMKLSVESILADKFQRSKQKALERKAETKSKRAKEKKGAKTKGEKKAKEKKSIDTKKPPRAFAPVCAQVAHVKEPPTVEWGVKPSEDESDFSIAAKVLIAGEFLQNRVTRVISSEANDEDAGGKEVDGQGVGVFLQKKVDRFLSSETNGDAGEKEVEARMEGQEPSFPRDAVLSVTPVRMNKKKKVAEQRSDGRGNELNEVGPDDVSYDSFFEDIASRSGSDTDSDSDYTTEVVQVDFDPSKLSDTMDADKFLAREVLRRYAEMTGVSLDELIEEVVDGSMASITLDTFPMER